MNDVDQQATTESDSEPLIDWQCFSYLTAEKGAMYRAIVDAFAGAKAEFVLHLRPSQVRGMLSTDGFSPEPTEIESALQQLEAWGNLQSYQDNADVSSLVDYYRKSLLYQMTAAGEAAHASTLTFEQRLQQQAKLDARALERIAEGAGQLERLAGQIRTNPNDVDAAVVLTAVRSICHDADELTSRAQSFFRWLHEQTESDRGDLEAFLTYKERLIDYLQQFVSELITSGSTIARRLNAISDSEYSRLAQFTAEEDVGLPLAGEETQTGQGIDACKRQWLQRLLGLRGWFSRSGGNAAQLEQLRAAARAAIPRLLQLAGRMNERQSGRSDRVADLRVLACRFLSCRDDAQAHRLYHAAFALSPARHLRIDQATIDLRDQNPVSTDTCWLDAEPVEFSPQLRKTGRQSAVVANRRVVDRSTSRAAANRRLSTEVGRIDSSRETLISLGRCRLSDVGELDRDAFRLMMELIELAVPRPTTPATQHRHQHLVLPAEATSRDGSVHILVHPIARSGLPSFEPSGNGKPEVCPTQEIACLTTPTGHVMLPEMWIEVTRAN